MVRRASAWEVSFPEEFGEGSSSTTAIDDVDRSITSRSASVTSNAASMSLGKRKQEVRDDSDFGVRTVMCGLAV